MLRNTDAKLAGFCRGCMNKFFDRYEWRRGFPKLAFARLDDLEPIASETNDELTFIFDAVDAEWSGFGFGGLFDLESPDLQDRIASRWLGSFDGRHVDGPDGYEEVPVYRVEMTLPRDHGWFEFFPRNEEAWITLDLTDQPTDVEVYVYGGLFSPPTQAFLRTVPTPAPSGPLNILFDMTTWPDASQQSLLQVLQRNCNLDALVCFDIGQGSASALVSDDGYPTYYFDTGCGSGRNAPTAPSRIDFCTCNTPVVILSHWDTDHWAGALGHSRLNALNWVAPRQTISASHTLFANAILKGGGKIHIVGSATASLQWSTSYQKFDLQRGTGARRNGTGLILIVTDRKTSRAWVLTGDAGYNVIPQSAPTDIAAMVVPHHGADMGAMSIPFQRSAANYARLFYSFGPSNAHGPRHPPVQHPVTAAVSAHINRGWPHGIWMTTPVGNYVAGGDVLATAMHPATHLQGGAAGWIGPPRLGHLITCPNALPIPQQ